MIKITSPLLEEVSKKAKASPRLRMNHNFHTDLGDTLQRLLNAMEPGTYIRPHRHQEPDKREVFIVFKGRAVVVEFNEDGEIRDQMILDASIGNHAVEIPQRTWHTILSLEKDTMLFEFKDGPYSPIDDKHFAPWAPKEGDPAADDYNRELLKKLGLQI
jgi:cupin fold WbuC family metalloprotein